MSQSEYRDMIEIPVSTCEMVVLPKKKKRNNVKKRVIDKVNKKTEKAKTEKIKKEKAKIDKAADFEESTTLYSSVPMDNEQAVLDDLQPTNVKIKKKKGFNFDLVSAQVIAVFVLIVGILLTNIFWENSGINRLIGSVFNKQENVQKNYSDFNLAALKGDDINLSEGVITINGKGAVYSPCEGVISKIEKVGDKYTVTINHSDSFSSEFTNLDFCYFEEGENVFSRVPIAYMVDGCQMRMFSNEALLTNYVINDGAIIWES